MTSMPVQPVAVSRGAEGEIGGKLRAVWRRQRLGAHVRGLCLTLIWCVALLLMDLVIDWLFLLPGYARVLLLASNLAAIAWVVHRRWWSRLQPFDPVRVALQVERDNPQLRSLLVSYVQLEEDQGQAAASPQLIAAMRRQALEQARPIDFTRVVDLADLRRLALFCAVCLLVFGGLSVNWPNVLRTLVVRLLNPTAQVAYPTRTRIDAITGDLVVRQGDPITLTASASGLVPINADLLVRSADARRGWERLGLLGDEHAAFTHHVERSVSGFEYQMRIGDATSLPHRVTVVPPPAMQRLQVRIEPPAYTGITPVTRDTLNLDAPADSLITWTLTLDRPLRDATMIPADGQPLPMSLSSDGVTASITLPAEQTFFYTLQWTDRDHDFAFADGVRYTVRVTPDQPPQVTLIRPAQDDLATRQVRLPIAFQAADDYGLADATIVYQHNEGDEQRLPIGVIPAGSRSYVGEYVWPIAQHIPALREGDVVAFTIEVRDNRQGDAREPNAGRSPFRRINIVSPAQYEAHIAARQRELMDMLQGLRREEETAGEQVEQLLRQAPALQE